MNISLISCTWIKFMIVDSSLFSKLHKWTTFHARVKKIPCDKEDTEKKAPVCLEELISLYHGSPFHILLFSRVTLFPTQIVMWGNWVCGKQPPLTGAQMGFLVFRLSPHNHYYVYFHISSSTPTPYTFWFLTNVYIHLFSSSQPVPQPSQTILCILKTSSESSQLHNCPVKRIVLATNLSHPQVRMNNLKMLLPCQLSHLATPPLLKRRTLVE